MLQDTDHVMYQCLEKYCIPVVDSCLYMAKPIQYCKVKNLKKRKVLSLTVSQSWGKKPKVVSICPNP